MSKQLALVAEGKRLGLIVVLAALLAALAAVGAPMWGGSAHAQSQTDLCPGLYHVDAFGNLVTGTFNGDCTPAGPAAAGATNAYTIANNVISYSHEVCAISPIPGGPDATSSNTTFGSGQSPFTYYFNVVGLGAGNTPAALNGTIVQNPYNSINNLNDFSEPEDIVCATWTSVQPGDQQVTLNANINNNPILGAATGNPDTTACAGANNNAQVQGCDPLIKEWNVLSPTTITTGVETSPSATDPTTHTGVVTNTSVSGNLIFDPSQSAYIGQSGTYYENVWGTHTPNQGTQQFYLVAGARVTFTNDATATGGCGILIIGNGVDSTSTPNTAFTNATGGWPAGENNTGNIGIDNNNNNTTTVTSVGVPIPFHFVSSKFGADVPCANPLGSFSSVTITVAYPGSVGSDKPTFPAETLRVNWKTPPPAAKQVLLAWAGQTVILEHDWRLPPGDTTDLDPAGVCAFNGDSFAVEYDRQANSPGSFVPGLDAVTILQSGQSAIVQVSTDTSQQDTAPGDPQGSCISRVLYESEDQGEVDIVAYQQLPNLSNPGQNIGDFLGSGTDNQTTYPFVIYYMNLNTVNLTTVAATKPSHNSSVAADWTPSNPWDASKETDTATSNVSADVLVRGRVTGWFLNSIPSGRAADSANHLPADRWVMPDDWAQLAGGALATSFRPSYDLMFSPSNTGLALVSPTNLSSSDLIQVAVTLDGSGTGALANNNPNAPTPASPILVAANANIKAGDSIMVGSQGPATVAAVAAVTGGKAILLTAPIAKPATGTPIYEASGGVPFEGPYSLIDIPGLAASNGGVAGAALSNLSASGAATRDTVLGDGTIDWWDAPMPPANISVSLRGAGFIKQVIKSDVYYLGAANSTAQTFPNPYYVSNIPDSPYLPAAVAGGSYLWNSWGPDGPVADGGIASDYGNDGSQGQGPYTFWSAVIVGGNELGVGETQSAVLQKTLADAQADYGDSTIARDLTIFSDNHGEFMVAANGDANLDYSGCSTNSLGGGHECKPGDAVGTGTVTAVADYPMLKKHAPIGSNAATIDWTWGGYKSITIEKDPAGNAQFVYVVFHALDRDGHCSNADGAVLLHSVLTGIDGDTVSGTDAAIGSQLETVDFKIDSGDGIILGTNSNTGTLNDGAHFATGVNTYSLAAAKAKVTGTPTTYFPMDAANAASGQTDECQAWIKVSNSLLGQTNVLTIAHDDEGNIGFDRVLDFQQTQDYTLNFRWTLFTWAGADNIPVADALAGGADTKNPQGNDITDQVTAIYGWEPTTQTWLGYFPSGVNVPGANDLTSFHTGQAYWIAIKGPGNVTWTITTNVS
ncbi:hypothetical protein J0H33_11885 [bacterium]|nr:hypothetical protein [bacterium]